MSVGEILPEDANCLSWSKEYGPYFSLSRARDHWLLIGVNLGETRKVSATELLIDARMRAPTEVRRCASKSAERVLARAGHPGNSASSPEATTAVKRRQRLAGDVFLATHMVRVYTIGAIDNCRSILRSRAMSKPAPTSPGAAAERKRGPRELFQGGLGAEQQWHVGPSLSAVACAPGGWPPARVAGRFVPSALGRQMGMPVQAILLEPWKKVSNPGGGHRL